MRTQDALFSPKRSSCNDDRAALCNKRPRLDSTGVFGDQPDILSYSNPPKSDNKCDGLNFLADIALTMDDCLSNDEDPMWTQIFLNTHTSELSDFDKIFDNLFAGFCYYLYPSHHLRNIFLSYLTLQNLCQN